MVLRIAGKYRTTTKKVFKMDPKVLYALRDTAAPKGNRWGQLVDGKNGGRMDAHRDV